MNTRDMIGEFQRAFRRPINDVLTTPTVSDRLLLGSILLEEVIETVTKGLGLAITINGERCAPGLIGLEHPEGVTYDPIETADGLGDINVVIHFNAHWLGMNLDKITEEINNSNMSKLASDGTPIINDETFGYRSNSHLEEGKEWMRRNQDLTGEPGYRSDLPSGKILKGPNFRLPDIAAAIGLCDRVSCPLEGKPHRHADSMEGSMSNDNSMTRHGPAD